MIATLEIFTTLGSRLATLSTTPEGEAIIAKAIADNPWFTRDDILHAVEAIRHDMLSRESLSRWLDSYRPVDSPQDVALIMAGNIPLVGFNDLLCVIASGHRCHLKPSSKDSVLMRYIVGLLRDIEPSVPIYDYSPERHYDIAIATGGEDANRYFREHFANTRTLLRGSRHSLAVLDGRESSEELEALSRDVSRYSGLGCRSVSMIMLPRGCDIELPKSECVNHKLGGNIRTMRALMTMQGKSFRECGAYLVVESREFPKSLATVSLCYYDDWSSVKGWIEEHREEIQCIVSHTDIEGSVPFGCAQRPTLWDYADGVDTMKFLSDI